MTVPLPEPRPTDTDGQRERTAQEIADQLIAAVNEAVPHAPARQPAEPLPHAVGPQPVVQPGTPPMTPRETQIGRVALYGGAGLSLPILAGSVFMVATEHANPAVIAWSAGSVAALALLVAAVGSAVRRLVAAVPPPPPEIHIAGDLYQDQRNIYSRTSGVWAKSTNQQ
ncbi:hypothetical protein [Streptomyces sp.]|uniref:hypothetical protein n=1 Tax=Streptomyces sp. TaxID=1931 RepID=UPI0028128881|nr:hypothetical protein [Streptomyces sp.]